ncbi:hypothetical protein HDU93_006644 [Gonapodya sp. JEL0774]|nr:hypothetical protein HDU93_006644 [Gonapodya sp. JEL0774]
MSDSQALHILKTTFLALGVFPPDDSPRQLRLPPHNAQSFSYSDTLRTIKYLFTLREYDAIFNDPLHPERLAVYSAEYVPGRALGYADLFGSVEQLREVFENPCGEKLEICCLGGGCGSEMLGLTALALQVRNGNNRNGKEGLSSSSNESPTLFGTTSITRGRVGRQLTIRMVDYADYSMVLAALESSIRTTWGVKKEEIDFKFEKANILNIFSPGGCENNYTESHVDIISSASIVTLLFTLNELFQSSKKDTVKVIEGLVEKMRRGALLVCADSSGTFSDLQVTKTAVDGNANSKSAGKSEPRAPHSRTSLSMGAHVSGSPVERVEANSSPSPGTARLVPVYRLLDILATPTKSNPKPHFETVYSTDSRWYRVAEGVNATVKGGKSTPGVYPCKVENMRYWCRVLRKT